MTLPLFSPTLYSNIGDIIGLPIAQHFLDPNTTMLPNAPPGGDHLMLVGSIAGHVTPHSIACGIGMISSDATMPHKPKTIHALRGPLTRYFCKRAGIDAPEVYGDPAVLTPAVFPPSDAEPIYDYGLIPHYVDKYHPAVGALRDQGVHILDVFQPPAIFLRELQQCRVIFSSSLHGIIFAHSYRRPALWVRMSDEVIGGGFKFLDYYLSLGISPEKVAHVVLTGKESPHHLAPHAELHLVRELQAAIKGALGKVKEEMFKSS